MTNKERYIKICEEKKDIPLFLQPWWLDTVCKQWDVAIAVKGVHITGAWPYPVEKKIGVPLLRNPALTPYLGPHVFYPPDVKESNLDSFEHETVAALLQQIPDVKVWHLALQPGMKQVGLFKKYNLKPQAQQTFLLALNDDEDTLLGNMKDTMRRNIRMAEKEIEVTCSSKHLKDLYKFQRETLIKKGKPLPYSLKFAERIMAACEAHHSATLWVAKSAGNIQAIVWQVWDNHCSYYFMGGQNHEANSYKAMSLLLWNTIKDAKRRGHAWFDLEGSMDEGVERFFRNFGGDRALYLVLHKNDSLLWRMKKMILK